ncbi:MAG: 30S ribosomal protein S17 [Desulfatiglans sp.]|jgi:small subunit ribosomal protein S17|nr:30S ribosomal protein S17 [Desulfatiglans sp.]
MKERGIRRKLTGVVVGTKMDKTIVVMVSRLKKHSTYNKFIRRQTKYLVHDPKNICQEGDRVRIIESRPISRLKRWHLVEIVEKSQMSAPEVINDLVQE